MSKLSHVPLAHSPAPPPIPDAVRPWRLRLLFCLLAILASLAGSPRPAPAQGWIFSFPANLVTMDPGRRNPVFTVGETVAFTLKGSAAATYEVRDYWGNVVDQGKAQTTLKPNVTQPGWYKVTLLGSQPQAPWGRAVGGTTFVIFRADANFPALPPAGTPYGSYPSMDSPLRGLVGMGPMRLFVQDAANPDAEIARLDGDLALEKKYYLPFDSTRKRVLMIAFPNGTKNLAGVRKIVDHFKDSVLYWEPRNEPNGNSTGKDFATNEMKPFYETVKSVDPKLRVLGPGTVSVSPVLLPWIEDFLKAGGGKYLDAFSFHAYNAVNGDFWLGRATMDGLNALLAKYGLDKVEKWQTEQGYFAATYGAYMPRHQGRWQMAQAMLLEQYGIPKEHSVYFYERSHGFWDFPTWWENNDGSLNPAGALMRVWSEELAGTNYAGAYDFGPTGNKFYLGSLFQGASKTVAAFMSAGLTDGKVTLSVNKGSSLRVVSAFGVVSTLPVVNGMATLPVPEIPVYVELTGDQSISVVPLDWGPNRALDSGVTVVTSGVSQHPVSATLPNDPGKIINGKLENWSYTFANADHPWMSNVAQYPATVEIRLPVPTPINHVAIYCPTPWQWDSTLLDYELQYDSAGQWKTIERVTEPAQSVAVMTPFAGCMADTYHSERCLFTHTFAPVTTQKLRLVVYETTWGGGTTPEIVKAGGQTGPHQISLREIEIYSPYDANASLTLKGRIADAANQGIAGMSVTLSGSQTATTTTDAQGNYTFPGLPGGSNVTITPVSNEYTFSPRSHTISQLNASSAADFTATAIKQGSGTGLRSEYYISPDYTFPILPNKLAYVKINPNIDFGGSATKVEPTAAMAKIAYCVRWVGTIEPKSSTTYTFHTNLYGGTRLWIGDQLLIDDWNPAPVFAIRDRRVVITLQAGRHYPIRMEYFQYCDYVLAHLYWSSSNQPEQAVPQSQLYPATFNTPPTIGLASPLDGAVYNVGDMVSINATAFDSDGTVAQVRFFANGTLIGTSFKAPFGINWSCPQPGTYTLTAQAIDDMGAATMSAPVTINVAQAGQVVLPPQSAGRQQ